MNLADHKKITDSNKVEKLHVTSDMAADSAMDQELRDGICKETAEIEHKLRTQTELPNLEEDPEKKEELFQNIMWALKRKGEWEEEPQPGTEKVDPVASLSPEDRKALEIGRKIQNDRKHPIRRILLKYASKAAIVLLGVFVLGMSTEANRKKVMGVWNDIVNGELRIHLDNVEDTIQFEIPEQEAYSEIENQLGITPLKFMTMVEKLEYNGYTINIRENKAMLFYQYEDTMVTIYMYSPNSDANRNGSFEGKVLSTVITKNDMLELEIREIENEKDDNLFVTNIVYEGAYYYITGKIPQDIFENLVREIYF